MGACSFSTIGVFSRYVNTASQTSTHNEQEEDNEEQPTSEGLAMDVSKNLHALQTVFPKELLDSLIPDVKVAKQPHFTIRVGDAEETSTWDGHLLPPWRVAEFLLLFLKTEQAETPPER